MTKVRIDGETIRISLDGWDKVWALRGGIEIPLAHVRAARVAPPGLKPRGIRAPGTAVPGRYFAGTWRGKRRKEFWNVRTRESALVLDLEGDEFTRVVIGVADPTALVAEIDRAKTAPTAGA
jgi:hypothetical protein